MIISLIASGGSSYFSFLTNPSIVAPSLIFLNTKSTVSYICVYIGPVNSRLSKNTAGPVPLNTAHCVLENGKYPDVSNA
jgi:hypothetical protein